jgi:hypothetical protein
MLKAKGFIVWSMATCAVALSLVRPSIAAESKQVWQADWDKTVAAAKKEGRLNFYVGRYGSEKLLNEFRNSPRSGSSAPTAPAIRWARGLSLRRARAPWSPISIAAAL